ncbi:hypothetical protein H8958_015714, partial [Nasalis larvatus]
CSAMEVPAPAEVLGGPEPLMQCTAWLKAYFHQPEAIEELPVPALHHPVFQQGTLRLAADQGAELRAFSRGWGLESLGPGLPADGLTGKTSDRTVPSLHRFLRPVLPRKEPLSCTPPLRSTTSPSRIPLW